MCISVRYYNFVVAYTFSLCYFAFVLKQVVLVSFLEALLFALFVAAFLGNFAFTFSMNILHISDNELDI